MFMISKSRANYQAIWSIWTIDDWLSSQVLGSLRRLQLSQIDTLLLHEPLDLLSDLGSKIFDRLKFFQASGLIKKIGISVYDTKVVHGILEIFDIDGAAHSVWWIGVLLALD